MATLAHCGTAPRPPHLAATRGRWQPSPAAAACLLHSNHQHSHQQRHHQQQQPGWHAFRVGRSSARLQPCTAWTQVTDQATGKPYFWNTATNETTWELPTAATAVIEQPPQQQQQQLSHEQLFEVLSGADAADGTGMHFAEVARAHRQHGVFEASFFDHLDVRQRAAVEAGDEAARELAYKVMCRLANPLLRQPAPFE